MRSKFLSKHFSLIVTCAVFLIAFCIGGGLYRNFFSLRVFFNLMIDGGYVGLMAIGMTVVILTGGIDLSVAAVVSTVAMFIAYMDGMGYGPEVVIPLAIIMGTLFGFIQGYIIHTYDVAPFIVTLAGQFFARGMGYIISLSSIPLKGDFYDRLSYEGISIGKRGFNFFGYKWVTKLGIKGGSLTTPALMFIVMLIIGIIILKYTKFGRNVYALGGNEKSALFMGIPVGRTKMMVYAFSGLCSALGGIAYSFYTLSGYGLAAMGDEMDAIAAVVIGGTMMSGGVGNMFGTFVGVLILKTITTMVSFQGTLNTYWTKIFIGLLLFSFIFFQNVISKRKGLKG